jgi:protein phosphatase
LDKNKWMQKAETIEFAADTHAGLKRKHNEDCFEADATLGLWLVADGVGGHSCGDVASDIVRTTVRNQTAAGESLPDAIVQAHQAVLEQMEQDENASGMGSTIVALRLEGDNYELAWVGDSRAYLWNSRLQLLSHDHNRVSELLDQGIITPRQAANHPQRHVLTQSLGVSERMALEPGHREGTLSENQQILLCSDGLTDELPDEMIATILAGNATPRAQVDALIDAALQAGGKDNITAVVIGAAVTRAPSGSRENLETTHNTDRAAAASAPPGRRFPLGAWLLMSALLLLALWLVL